MSRLNVRKSSQSCCQKLHNVLKKASWELTSVQNYISFVVHKQYIDLHLYVDFQKHLHVLITAQLTSCSQHEHVDQNTRTDTNRFCFFSSNGTWRKGNRASVWVLQNLLCCLLLAVCRFTSRHLQTGQQQSTRQQLDYCLF